MEQMTLIEIIAWLEKKVEAIGALIEEANEKRRMDIAAELIKAEALLVAKLADARITHATIR